MDPEGQDLDVPLLSSIPDCIDSIKVFPFVIHLKRDVIVRTRKTISILFVPLTLRRLPFLGMVL